MYKLSPSFVEKVDYFGTIMHNDASLQYKTIRHESVFARDKVQFLFQHLYPKNKH
jgi:hypothetical protein